jgi:two-component system, chemotaxis family, sensor kinase CheA
MDDLRDDFIAETRETLETLATQLVAWEKNPSDHALIDSVFRFVHTVKGSCGFLELPRLEKLSHAAEDILSVARDGRLAVNNDMVSAVLAVIDRIAELTDAMETGASINDDDHVLVETMMVFHPDHTATGKTGTDPNTIIDDITTEIGFAETGLGKSRTVRVSLQQLDKLMNGVSDLVLARNELSRQLRSQGITAELDQAFSRLSGTVAEIRDSISLVRMQPISRLFSAIPRLLRDACVELGKEIEFSISGGEVELDREMVETLRDPLTHIIRNAADHGIEKPQERIEAGKSPIGRIHIDARQVGNQIVVDIRDDGRGINLSKLRQSAINRKLVTQQQWDIMDDSARLQFIFEPGLSTAESITSISGRGVGMDVVRNNLQSIGATIDLKSNEGKGLEISLLLPLTLSIVAGLSVRAGGQLFALSRSSIVEILSTTNPQVSIEEVGSALMAKVRGTRYIYAKLEDILDLEQSSDGWGSRSLAIIRPANGATFALEVESVVDTEELVVKPCAPLIMATGLYAGTSLPDNGKPMLLLDAGGLAAEIGAAQLSSAWLDNIGVVEQDIEEDIGDTLPVLLFNAIGGRTCALPLSIVERMEDVRFDEISKLGGLHVVNENNASFHLIGLADIPESGFVKVLRITDGQQTKYYAIDDVIDIFSAVPDRTLASLDSTVDCIVHINSQPVELLSAYNLFLDGASQGFDVDARPLCFVQSDRNDGWEKIILRPLLESAGYNVSFNIAEKENAAVILQNADTDDAANDPRTILLRSSIKAMSNDNLGSIYRYDRLQLLSAIESRMVGKA